MPAGQPTKYTKKLADDICILIRRGFSIKTITADPKMPSEKTIYNWLADDDHTEFLQQYVRARNTADVAYVEMIFDNHEKAISQSATLYTRIGRRSMYSKQ